MSQMTQSPMLAALPPLSQPSGGSPTAAAADVDQLTLDLAYKFTRAYAQTQGDTLPPIPPPPPPNSVDQFLDTLTGTEPHAPPAARMPTAYQTVHQQFCQAIRDTVDGLSKQIAPSGSGQAGGAEQVKSLNDLVTRAVRARPNTAITISTLDTVLIAVLGFGLDDLLGPWKDQFIDEGGNPLPADSAASAPQSDTEPGPQSDAGEGTDSSGMLAGGQPGLNQPDALASVLPAPIAAVSGLAPPSSLRRLIRPLLNDLVKALKSFLAQGGSKYHRGPSTSDVGTTVHESVQREYLKRYRGNEVVYDQYVRTKNCTWQQCTLSSLAKTDEKWRSLKASLSIDGATSKPDILDIDARTFYEIKPMSAAGLREAPEQMARYFFQSNMWLVGNDRKFDDDLVEALTAFTADPDSPLVWTELKRTIHDAFTPGTWDPSPLPRVGNGEVVFVIRPLPGLILYFRVKLSAEQEVRQLTPVLQDAMLCLSFILAALAAAAGINALPDLDTEDGDSPGGAEPTPAPAFLATLVAAAKAASDALGRTAPNQFVVVETITAAMMGAVMLYTAGAFAQ